LKSEGLGGYVNLEGGLTNKDFISVEKMRSTFIEGNMKVVDICDLLGISRSNDNISLIGRVLASLRKMRTC
jgi:hypothetical protein